jgi:hypothetical protein
MGSNHSNLTFLSINWPTWQNKVHPRHPHHNLYALMEIVNLQMNSKPKAPNDDDENWKPKDAKLNNKKSQYMKLYINATHYFPLGIPNKTHKKAKTRSTFRGPNNLGTLFFHPSTIQISLANISLIQTCFAKYDHSRNLYWISPFPRSQTPNHGFKLCLCKMYTMQHKLHILLLKNYHLHLWAFTLWMLLSNIRLQQVDCKNKTENQNT